MISIALRFVSDCHKHHVYLSIHFIASLRKCGNETMHVNVYKSSELIYTYIVNISNYISSEICSIETDVQWGLPWPTHKTGELATLACSLVVGNESLLELVG